MENKASYTANAKRSVTGKWENNLSNRCVCVLQTNKEGTTIDGNRNAAATHFESSWPKPKRHCNPQTESESELVSQSLNPNPSSVCSYRCCFWRSSDLVAFLWVFFFCIFFICLSLCLFVVLFLLHAQRICIPFGGATWRMSNGFGARARALLLLFILRLHCFQQRVCESECACVVVCAVRVCVASVLKCFPFFSFMPNWFV